MEIKIIERMEVSILSISFSFNDDLNDETLGLGLKDVLFDAESTDYLKVLTLNLSSVNGVCPFVLLFISESSLLSFRTCTVSQEQSRQEFRRQDLYHVCIM